MKFFFLKTDSLYKILKTLERIPPQKPVEIFIDPEHAFFENARRGKQVFEIIQQRKLNITFLAEKDYNRRFLQQLGLKVQQQEERLIFKLLKTASLFLFDIKKFHLHAYNQQKYLFYMVFAFEVLIGFALLWFLFLLLIPSTKITIQVAQQKENIIYNFRYYPHDEPSYLGAIQQLSIPYYTGSIDYVHSLAISTENIHHISNPSVWSVKIYNRTPNEINLKPKTRFVSAEGLVFYNKDTLIIPAGKEDSASEFKTKLIAAEFDENQLIIWTRGNIPANTRLTIKALPESHHLGHIWAESLDAFTGGSKTSLGLVSEKDHQLLSQKLKESIFQNKLAIVKSQFQEKKSLVLLFDPLVKTTIDSITIDSKIGEKATTLKGSIKVQFSFIYLKWDEVLKAFSEYVQQRQSDIIQLISIDPSTLTFLAEPQQSDQGGHSEFKWLDEKVFSLPTRVSILQGYDFSRDVKEIQTRIKNEIIWKPLDEARKIILSYPEVSSVKIDLGLLGGQMLPTIKSRIHIKTEL